MGGKQMLYCSFCGKSQDEVRKLIAGPTVFICNECVELCQDICDENINIHPPLVGYVAGSMAKRGQYETHRRYYGGARR